MGPDLSSGSDSGCIWGRYGGVRVKRRAPRDDTERCTASRDIRHSSRYVGSCIVSVETLPARQVRNAGEIERLKTRNRRLEALVSVLRQRAERGSAETANTGQ